MAREYREIFFVYCVPGLALVLVGSLLARHDWVHFGIALLALGLIHYGRTKGYRRGWTAVWTLLCLVYVVLGILEVFRTARGGV